MLLPGNPPSGSEPNTTAKGGTWSSQSTSRAFAAATISVLGKVRANDIAVVLFPAMKQVNTNGGALSCENDEIGSDAERNAPIGVSGARVAGGGGWG